MNSFDPFWLRTGTKSLVCQGRGQSLLPRCVAVAAVALLGGLAEGLRNFAFNMLLGCSSSLYMCRLEPLHGSKIKYNSVGVTNMNKKHRKNNDTYKEVAAGNIYCSKQFKFNFSATVLVVNEPDPLPILQSPENQGRKFGADDIDSTTSTFSSCKPAYHVAV